MIKIGIVDDQIMVRQGIVNLIELNSHFSVIIQAENGKDALDNFPNHQLDIVITDMRMPVMNGVELIKNLRDKNDTTPILVLTAFSDNELLTGAISAGANGFILKDVTLEKLKNAIESVASGKLLFEPQSVGEIESDVETPKILEELTETEKQILRLAAAGFSNKDISQCIHLAEGTVKNYISRILEKTHSRDRTHAVVKAMASKVI